MSASSLIDDAMARLRPLLVELEPDQFLWAERSYRDIVLPHQLAPALAAADDARDVIARRAIDRICSDLQQLRRNERWIGVCRDHYDARVAPLSQRALLAARSAVQSDPSGAALDAPAIRGQLHAVRAEIASHAPELGDRYAGDISEALLDCEYALDPSTEVLSLRRAREGGATS